MLIQSNTKVLLLDNQERKNTSAQENPRNSRKKINWKEQDLIASSQGCDDHPYVPLLKAIRTNKKPILQVVHAQGDVFKTNP